MKLMHPWFQRPISFTENRIQVLVLENRGLFSHLTEEFCIQSEGEKGGFILSEEDLLDCAVCLDVVMDYFHLSPDRKRLQAKFLAKMKTAAQQELQLETMAIQEQLHHYLQAVMDLFDYPLQMEQEDNIGALLKACGPKLSFAGESLAENLLNYMMVYRDLAGIKCFVLVNLKAYLSGEELKQFYRDILTQKISVLLLESDQRELIPEHEDVRLLDEDFCELYLAERGEM